jgi:hypothetical protein
LPIDHFYRLVDSVLAELIHTLCTGELAMGWAQGNCRYV